MKIDRVILTCVVLAWLSLPFRGIGRVKQHASRNDIKNIIDSVYYDQNLGKDTITIASLSWKELFTDIRLQHLITTGIANNNDLKVAEARIKNSRANFIKSKRDFLPDLSLMATGSRQKVSGSSSSSSYNTFSLLGEASWEADIWGKLSSLKKANLYLFMKSEAYKREVQTQVVASIAEYYYTLLAYDQQLEILERTIKNRGEDLQTTRDLYEFGQSTSLDVNQSLVNVQSAKLTEISLEQSITQTENALCTLLGITSQKIQRAKISDDLDYKFLQTGIPIQLLANRPDVQEAEYQLRYYLEMGDVARAYFYPSLTISGDIGWQSSQVNKLINPTSFVWSLLGSLTQPIFKKGENLQRLEVAKANIEEYSATFKQKLLEAVQEVNDYMVEYKKGKELESERKMQIENLKKSITDTKFLMTKSTLVNYLDVLNEEQTLLSSELSVISDKLQQTNAIIGLYRSLGGGWK